VDSVRDSEVGSEKVDSGQHTDDGKRLEPGDQFVLDILRRVGVVVRGQRVLEEGDGVLGGVQGPELGLGYPLVVVEDCDFG
jgi:hypothetical protein